jgi:hypothetical protein
MRLPLTPRRTRLATRRTASSFDPDTPNPTRTYNDWPGGKDHHAADRAEAERLLTIYPPLRDLARENRALITQAVTWAARGIVLRWAGSGGAGRHRGANLAGVDARAG